MTLQTALVAMMSRPRILLGLDFDGTLAPLVDDPDHATPDPGAWLHVSALTREESVDVLILSGRAHADLAERVGELHGVRLVGEHGNDPGDGAGSAEMGEMDVLLETLVARTPGSRVEKKPTSRAFHTRTSPVAAAEEANSALRDWARGREDVRVLEGKDIVELTLGERTKGDVISAVADSYDGVIYIGDDTTDETVFEILRKGDIGIKVGEGPTRATFRVTGVAEVAGILETMVASLP